MARARIRVVPGLLLLLVLPCFLVRVKAFTPPSPRLARAAAPVRSTTAARRAGSRAADFASASSPSLLVALASGPEGGSSEEKSAKEREEDLLKVDFEFDALTIGLLIGALIAFQFFVLANL